MFCLLVLDILQSFELLTFDIYFLNERRKRKQIFQIFWTIFMRWLNHYLLANFHKWWPLLEYGNILSVKTLYCTSRKCVLHPSYQYIDNNQDQNIDYQFIALIFPFTNQAVQILPILSICGFTIFGGQNFLCVKI